MIQYLLHSSDHESDGGCLEELDVECPWCWQRISLSLDCSNGDQSYSEDCAVCCRPMLLQLTLAVSGGTELSVSRESD
jgi:hypothetical protein